MSRLNRKAWALAVLVAGCGGGAESDPDQGAGLPTDGTAMTSGSGSEATLGTGTASTEGSGDAAGGMSGEAGAGDLAGTGAEPTGQETTGATGGASTEATGTATTSGIGGQPTGATGGASTGAAGAEATGGTGGQPTGPTGGVSTGATGGNSGIGGDDVGGSAGAGSLACDAIPGPCTRTWHSPVSGTTTTTTYFYNALGQLERQEEDRDGDGVADHTVRYTYDEQGRLVQRKADSCDAVATLDPTCERMDYTYDEQGNVLVESYYSGAPNSTSGCTYSSYDEDGALLSREFYSWCIDTLPGYSMTYEYDAAGRLVAEHRVNPNGTTLYEYDAADQVSTSTHLDADGIVTHTVVSTRNAAGQPLIEEYQYPDGDDTQLVRTYDARGNPLTRKLVYLEGDSTGSDAFCWVATYDDCGNQLTEIYSPECSDVVTTETTWSYACFTE